MKAYKNVAAAKRAATIAFGKGWEDKYDVVPVNYDGEEGFDLKLKAPSIGDVVQAECDARNAPEVGAPIPDEPEVGDDEAEDDVDGEGDTVDSAEGDTVDSAEEGEPEEDAPAVNAFKGDRLKARKAAYVKHKHCGDDLATAVAGVETGVLLGAAEQLGVDVAKWSHLNNGQRRMNCGNVLRTMIKKADADRQAEILEVLRNLPRKVEVRVLRNGRPVKRCEDQAAADAFIAEMVAKVKEGEQAPVFKTEDVTA